VHEEDDTEDGQQSAAAAQREAELAVLRAERCEPVSCA